MVVHQLVDDAGLLTGGRPALAEVVRDFLAVQQGAQADSIGALVVPDLELAEVARAVPPGRELAVAVLNSTGARGLVTQARRSWPGLTVTAIESALRDLDDLAGNAARVVAAAGELTGEQRVCVELPYAPGWLRAVEVVEAAGLVAKVNVDAVPTVVATEQLSALVEADLAFKVSGLAPDRVPPLILAVAALVEGAEPGEAAELLAGSDPAVCAATIAGWDQLTQGRVRRRLVSCDSPDLGSTVAHLATAGLLD